MTEALDIMMYWYFRLECQVRPQLQRYNRQIEKDGGAIAEEIYDIIDEYKGELDNDIYQSFDDISEQELLDLIYCQNDEIFCEYGMKTLNFLCKEVCRYATELANIGEKVDNLLNLPRGDILGFPPQFYENYV